MEKRGDGADAELQFDADFLPDPSQVTLNKFFVSQKKLWFGFDLNNCSDLIVRLIFHSRSCFCMSLGVAVQYTLFLYLFFAN